MLKGEQFETVSRKKMAGNGVSKKRGGWFTQGKAKMKQAKRNKMQRHFLKKK